MTSGYFADIKPDPKAEFAETQLESVVVVPSHVELHKPQVLAPAELVPYRFVSVRSETDGPVKRVFVDDGDWVTQGDPICVLESSVQSLRLEQAKAAIRTATSHLEAQKQLQGTDFASAQVLRSAQEAYDRSVADRAQRQLDLDRRTITAPFDGRIEAVNVRAGDVMSKNHACASLLDPDPVVLRITVSERDLPWLQENGIVTAELATGGSVSAAVKFVARTGDSRSRSFRVDAHIANPTASLTTGISARAYLPLRPIPASLVPASALYLNDVGELRVRWLSSDDRVSSSAVQLIEDTNQGVWLAGVPDGVRVITIGQNYVSEGDTVRGEVRTPQEAG